MEESGISVLFSINISGGVFTFVETNYLSSKLIYLNNGKTGLLSAKNIR